ncbi:hypothetical protein ACFQ1T_10550 [Methylophilus glucosoxydans]|uniref:Uncharacterized protein n=1 Tax=Methylophilus glucosoxydans TaxID=752553 RepID=A0ABW3GIG2_9PROT
MDSVKWGRLHVSERKRYLENAGHSKNLAHRAFDYVPKNVINDITFSERFMTRSDPQAVSTKQHFGVNMPTFKLEVIKDDGAKTKNLASEIELLDHALVLAVPIYGTPQKLALALLAEINDRFGVNYHLTVLNDCVSCNG